MLTDKFDFVKAKKDLIFWITALILTATSFYLIGWIHCKLEQKEPLEIEDPPKTTQKIEF